jgi:hypothetical protein
VRDARGIVSAAPEWDVRVRQAFGVRADVGGQRRLEAADEQPARDEEDQRNRNLDGDEHAARPAPARGCRCALGLQTGHHVHTRPRNGRHQAGQQRREERRSRSKEKNPASQPELQRLEVDAARDHERVHDLDHPRRHCQPRHATENRQYQAFNHEQPNDLIPACTECQPDRGFAPTLFVARENQPGEVGAPDEQHQRDHHPEQRAEARRVRLSPR